MSERSGLEPSLPTNALGTEFQDAYARLLAWYLSHCDGGWEQSNRIYIQTTDSPGWTIAIDLRGTPLAASETDGERVDGEPINGRYNWYIWWVKGGSFCGHGGPYNLPDLLNAFHMWAEQASEPSG